MLTMIRRFYTYLRLPVVRARAFHRPVRIETRRLPNLTEDQQRVFDRASWFLAEVYRPTTRAQGR